MMFMNWEKGRVVVNSGYNFKLRWIQKLGVEKGIEEITKRTH